MFRHAFFNDPAFVITVYLKSTVPYDDAVPGASIAVQTYCDFLNHNPHPHAIVSDGCFLKDGSFHTASVFTCDLYGYA